ncbi:MAG: class I SAM-dependent methyltransferase [Flavobacteriales bacterium]|nr:class I SAM-dependent methyltransferase [Flavobacteriales bacterium]MCC6939689.1 class I SAM-dependent methyltransferase [Flavobacteriales bacterium]
MGWFKHWFGTRYYALLYGHRDADDANIWVDAIMTRWELPINSRVLDLGCGRGRHARRFMHHGMRVTGIDISEKSIAEAQELEPKGDFRVHDMRVPVESGTFDAACCLFTSLGYFESDEDDQRVFDAVSAALRPGGLFVLDFMNPKAVLRDLVIEESLRRENVAFEIRRAVEEGVLVKRISVSEGGSTEQFEERVRLLHPDELERMARAAGLELLDRTEGPVMSPFLPDHSRRFVLWARKPLA